MDYATTEQVLTKRVLLNAFTINYSVMSVLQISRVNRLICIALASAMLSFLLTSNTAIANELASKESIEAGKQLFQEQCIACHGKNAEGNQSLKSPNLAGLDTWYIANQLAAFKSGFRGTAAGDAEGAGMAAISKALNDININDLANYLHSLPTNIKPTSTIKGDAEAGLQFYDSVCGSCHGPGGEGNKALNSPKLAGLSDWYIAQQLKKFQSNSRGYHKDDRLGRQMRMMSGAVTDQKTIDNLSTYLSAQLSYLHNKLSAQ